MQNQNILLYIPYLLFFLLFVFLLYTNRKLKKQIRDTNASVRVVNYLFAGAYKAMTGASTSSNVLDPLTDPEPAKKLPLTEDVLLDAAEYEFSSILPHTSYEEWHEKCRELLPYPDSVDPSVREVYTDFVRKVASQWKSDSLLPKRELNYLDNYVQVSGASPSEIRNEISVFKQVLSGERDFQFSGVKDLNTKVDAYFRHIKKEYRQMLIKKIQKPKKVTKKPASA